MTTDTSSKSSPPPTTATTVATPPPSPTDPSHTTTEELAGTTIPSDYFSLTGEEPTAFPTDWSIGFVSLGTPVADVEEVLGAPSRTEPEEMYDRSDTWDLPEGAVLRLSSDSEMVSALSLTIPSSSPVRFALAGNVVAGASTVGDLVEGWGEPGWCADIDKAGCQLYYLQCWGVGDRVCPLLAFVNEDESLRGETGSTVEQIFIGVDQYPGSWERCEALELASVGLGVVDLGQNEAEALTELRRSLGPTPFDWAYDWTEPVGLHNGHPAKLRYREVAWPRIGFEAAFSDGVDWGTGASTSVLVSWFYWGNPDADLILTTSTGLTIGSSAAEVATRYGADLQVAFDEFFGWQGFVPSAFPDASPFVRGLTFSFDGDPAAAQTRVISISAGVEQTP